VAQDLTFGAGAARAFLATIATAAFTQLALRPRHLGTSL